MANLYNLSAARESELIDLADLYLDARRTLKTLDTVPENLLPTTQQEAYFVQDQMVEAYGAIGGYKIGAANATAEPVFAPMPFAWIAASASELAGPMHRLRILEGEIAFHIGADLPPRATPYTRDEVVAAIASAHPAIEVLESAITVPANVSPLAVSADMQYHGGFVYGPAVANWQSIDWSKESVALAVDGTIRVEKTASNPGGTDLLRFMVYLANEGTARTGGLKKGQWITTGSWTGNTPADASSSAEVVFSTAGRVTLSFASTVSMTPHIPQ